ncbi:MAG: hypothetical protein ABI925_07510 [Verrucomicrobiota bacterium]
MSYASIRYLLTVVFSSAAIFSILGQQPSPMPKQVSIQNVTLESAAVPGSNRPWIKVVTQFQSVPRWADGIAFSYTILLGAGDQYRVLPGIVRYANVKGGLNRAVMYVSPNTVERFGPPLTAHVRVYYKDEVADDFIMKGASNIPASWETQYNKYPGLLLTVINTPWLISDYSNSPDIFATQ